MGRITESYGQLLGHVVAVMRERFVAVSPRGAY